MSRYMLAIDQGTTSSRAIVFDSGGNIIAIGQQEFTQIFPESGWVEHDPQEIWQSQQQVVKDALQKAGINASGIAAIGITNQRETTVVWDRHTGQPIYNAIVWQDRRTAAICDGLKVAGHAETIRRKTGLVIDAYFSGTKIQWILDQVPGARARAEAGELAFGTIDSWLIWNLTGGKLHITDPSNASRTMLCNIHSREWDEELLALLKIPASLLPRIMPSSQVYGETHPELFGSAIPIAGIAGDQQAALFGQLCTQPGMVKNTYGTGCFMMMNTGTRAVASSNNLLTTIAWQIGDELVYALEGSIFIAGAVVQWLRDGLGIIKNPAEVEALARTVESSNGVVIVPAFAGLGAPYWNAYARGSVFGATRGTTSAHLARAAMDSIAYQTADVLKAMEADSQIHIAELRVDGGATNNDLLMQFQADILQTKVVRPKITETTALGAAYLAGLACGYWQSIDDLQQQWQIDRQFAPQTGKEQAEEWYSYWQRAVRASIAWANDREA